MKFYWNGKYENTWTFQHHEQFSQGSSWPLYLVCLPSDICCELYVCVALHRVKTDLDMEKGHLVTSIEEGSHCIVTLLLTGRATPYLHNGVVYVGDEDHYVRYLIHMSRHKQLGPLLWARRQHARLSRSGPGFYPQLGQVSWVRFFLSFSSPVRLMSGSFRPPRVPEYHLAIIIITHYLLQAPMTWDVDVP